MFGPPAWAPVLNNVVVIVTGLLFIAASGPGELTPVTITPAQVWLLGDRHHARHRRPGRSCCCRCCRRAGVPLRPRWGLKNTGLREAGTPGPVGDRLRRGQPGRRHRGDPDRERGRRQPGGLGSSAFANASLLFQMPYGIIGVALLTALLPRMSRAAARHDVPGVVARPLPRHPPVGAGAAAGDRGADRARARR